MASSPGWLADTRRSYDLVADGYAAYFPQGLEPHAGVRGAVAFLVQQLPSRRGRVLDVGCGTGLLAGELRRHDVQVVGLDLSGQMLRVAREQQGPALPLLQGSMTRLPLADACVDGALAAWSLIHLPDEAARVALDELRRVLRPGGVLAVGFHVGDRLSHKASGYGVDGIALDVHRRPVERMASWVREAGFGLTASLLLDPDAEVPGCVLLATA